MQATAANFPKTTVAVVQLLAVVCQTNLDKSRDLLVYLMEVKFGPSITDFLNLLLCFD